MTHKLKNNNFFIDIKWLQENIDDPNLVLLDIPYGMNEFIKEIDEDKREYEKEHIPGAIKIDKDELQDYTTDLNFFDAERLKNTFLSKGIDANTILVVYSDGIIASSRVALAAYWLGVKDVKILLGGYHRWKESDLPITSEISTVIPKNNFGVHVPSRPEIILSTPDDVLSAMNRNPEFILANIRSWEEYTGQRSGYPYIEGMGAPLHSVYAKASSNRVNVEEIISEDGEFGELNSILEEWSDWGITSDKEVTFFCGAGWRAAAVFFTTLQLGWKDVKVYDGGWYQWNKFHQLNPEKYPIQVGNPKSEKGIRIV